MVIQRFGYEISWQRKNACRSLHEWLSTYANAQYQEVNHDNFLEFVIIEQKRKKRVDELLS